MTENQTSASSGWQDDVVFSDEAIEPHFVARQEKLPPLLAEARAMERGPIWEPRPAIFLRQAKLLENYEDDYPYNGDPVRYFPTYQSLTDEELRGYFTWRAKARRGEYCPTSLPFIFLYIYELLNQIGVVNPMDGHEKLLAVNREYGATENKIPAYLNQWLMDYVVYYNLDASLLADTVQVVRDRCVYMLERVNEEDEDKIVDAIKQLAPRWLSRSKFYAEHFEDMDTVICRVLRRMDAHYAAKCKKTMTEQFFGVLVPWHIHIFSAAVFCDPLKRRDYEYAVDEQCKYMCKDGIWTRSRRIVTPKGISKLEKVLKTIDAVMREEFGYGSPIKTELSLKWLVDIIREEASSWLAEKNAPAKNKISIDLSQLAQIREDAAFTRDRLIVEEDMDADAGNEALPLAGNKALPVAESVEKAAGPTASEQPAAPLLSPVEKRFLRCLLQAGDLGWLRDEGLLLSVLVDGINEKLYDFFGDSVLDETPRVIEDYVGDLEEMVQA